MGSEVRKLATGAGKEADIFAMAKLVVTTIAKAEVVGNELAMGKARIDFMATTEAEVAEEL